MDIEKLIRIKLRADIKVKIELLSDVNAESVAFEREFETVNSLLDTLRYYSTDRDFAEFMDSIQGDYYPMLCESFKKKTFPLNEDVYTIYDIRR